VLQSGSSLSSLSSAIIPLPPLLFFFFLLLSVPDLLSLLDLLFLFFSFLLLSSSDLSDFLDDFFFLLSSSLDFLLLSSSLDFLDVLLPSVLALLPSFDLLFCLLWDLLLSLRLLRQQSYRQPFSHSSLPLQSFLTKHSVRHDFSAMVLHIRSSELLSLFFLSVLSLFLLLLSVESEQQL